MRTLIDFPDDDIRWLDAKARQEGKSRAALVRDAIAFYRAKTTNAGMAEYFGIWKDRADTGDAVDWQRRLRAEWTRPWDADYPEVRAEFPDLFPDGPDEEAQAAE